jgi:hypothetical protein
MTTANKQEKIVNMKAIVCLPVQLLESGPHITGPLVHDIPWG